MATTVSHLSLNNTFGAAFIGVIAAAILNGVSCVQGWYYFTHQSDRWLIKIVVGSVLVCDLIHQALISHAIYWYLITNYGNPAALGVLVWSLVVEVVFNGLIALFVQCFLTLRIWQLSNGDIWITSAVLSLVFAELACVLAYVHLSFQFTTYAQLATLKSLSIAVNALAAAGDVLIAAALCFLLHRSRTGFCRSDTIINKLMLFAVNTGLLTSICAVASLISIVTAPTTFLYIGFYFCLGRLYCNSILATLNARKSIRNAAENRASGGNISLALKDLATNTIINNGNNGNISVKIDTTKECVDDGTSDRSSKPRCLQFRENV